MALRTAWNKSTPTGLVGGQKPIEIRYSGGKVFWMRGLKCFSYCCSFLSFWKPRGNRDTKKFRFFGKNVQYYPGIAYLRNYYREFSSFEEFSLIVLRFLQLLYITKYFSNSRFKKNFQEYETGRNYQKFHTGVEVFRNFRLRKFLTSKNP